MPKIIKDLDKKILDVATELFLNNSYEDVEIKSIAKKVGIASGTIYNYFSSKEILFIKVYEKLLLKIIVQEKGELSKYHNPREKLKRFCKIVYDIFEKNHDFIATATIRRVMLKSYDNEKAMKEIHESFYKIYNEIENLYGNILRELKIEYIDDKFIKRSFSMLITSTHYMSMRLNGEKSENIDFINNWIDIFIVRK